MKTLNTYEVTYKNGNKLQMKAYSMEISNGKVYESAYVAPFSQGIPHIFSAENILSIEKVNE